METLTPKQKTVLQAIKGYFAKYGEMPSIRQLRNEVVHNGLKIKSSRSVFLYLNRLEEKGYIQRSTKDRGLVLVDKSDQHFIDVPILGTTNAGTPTIVAEQNIEGYLKISKRLIPNRNIFAVQVDGNSMNLSQINGKKINSGDYIIIDGDTKHIKNGDKVLVVIEKLATVKTYKKLSSEVIGLFPQSTESRHKPIYLTPEDDFIINGKVIDVFKQFNHG